MPSKQPTLYHGQHNALLLNMKKEVTADIIIAGFPGFGLVGTIAAGYIAEHLKAEKIGTAWSEDQPATIAIHENNIISPITLYNDKKNKILIINGITSSQRIEWRIAQLINDIAKRTKAKQVITIEGVGSNTTGDEGQRPGGTQTYYYTTSDKEKKILEKIGSKPLREGIIMGVTSALLVQPETALTTLFAEAHAQLPDSKAAATIIQTIDKYLGLDIDYKPLLKQAELLEQKIKTILQKGVEAQKQQEEKTENYFG